MITFTSTILANISEKIVFETSIGRMYWRTAKLANVRVALQWSPRSRRVEDVRTPTKEAARRKKIKTLKKFHRCAGENIGMNA